MRELLSGLLLPGGMGGHRHESQLLVGAQDCPVLGGVPGVEAFGLRPQPQQLRDVDGLEQHRQSPAPVLRVDQGVALVGRLGQVGEGLDVRVPDELPGRPVAGRRRDEGQSHLPAGPLLGSQPGHIPVLCHPLQGPGGRLGRHPAEQPGHRSGILLRAGPLPADQVIAVLLGGSGAGFGHQGGTGCLP
ncbi:hypothetical protein ACFFX0_11225 [Citricoccus parietis]|uniref:Uncharacterized protein n=1 Tax=Citricoccus parietis TaxID=592307 RepID=A0ABV5FZS6_9MICC